MPEVISVIHHHVLNVTEKIKGLTWRKVGDETYDFIKDFGLALKVTISTSKHRLAYTYIYVPLSSLFVLCIIYGVSRIIDAIGLQFPASVVCMLFFLGFLLIYEKMFGTKRTTELLGIIDVPFKFSLRWINVFFTPSFVTLPLSKRIPPGQAFTIAAIFAIGIFLTMIFVAYYVVIACFLVEFIKSLIFGHGFTLHHHVKNDDDNDNDVELESLGESSSSPPPPLNLEESSHHLQLHPVMASTGAHDQQEDSELGDLGLSRTQQPVIANLDVLPSHDSGKTSTSSDNSEYLKPIGSGEQGSDTGKLLSPKSPPVPVVPSRSNLVPEDSLIGEAALERQETNYPMHLYELSQELSQHTEALDGRKKRLLTPQERAKATISALSSVNGTNYLTREGQDGNDQTRDNKEIANEIVGILPRWQRFATYMIEDFSWFFYITILIAGLPIYITIGYSLVVQLPWAILMYKASEKLPAKWRRIFHPIMVSALFTIFGYYIFGTMRSVTLLDALRQYQTGRTYLYLFDKSFTPVWVDDGTSTSTYNPSELSGWRAWPGTGDFFSSGINISIMAMAIPTYNYRKDLFRHFGVVVSSNAVFGVITFFLYPPMVYHMGIPAEFSLGFVGRSMTLALALPAVEELGGNKQVVAVMAILSGMVGVLIGDIILKLIRIKKSNYLARGITMGINSSAVATADLLDKDPRAAALSSISFVLYGLFILILAAINPCVHLVRTWVGLPPQV